VNMRRIWPIGATVIAAGSGLLLLVHAGARPTSGPEPHRSPDVAAIATQQPPATTTPWPAPSPSPPAVDQAVATARAFLAAYASVPPGDTPGSLRARLRPYDTDRLDGLLAQGAGGGEGSSAGGDAKVSQVSVVGVAPDGRLVVTGLVAVAGSARYVELYLAGTAGGWRVDEVAL
jgi:hypothetical protein